MELESAATNETPLLLKLKSKKKKSNKNNKLTTLDTEKCDDDTAIDVSK